MIQLLGKTNIDFIGKKYIALGISAVMVIVGLFAIYQIYEGKARLGVDFAGGLSLQIRFSQDVTVSEVRSVLDRAGVRDVDIQDLPTERKILIKLKKTEKNSQEIIESALKLIGDKEPTVESITEIGPKIGQRTKKDALLAIAAATVGILIYIAIRFRFHFAIGATVATFHDVMAVVGLFYLLGKEINLIFISALLTIAGYSLTDTVVVFDRIRENLKVATKTIELEALINKSINEVLSRTIITSATTFIAAAALFFFGGEVLHDFALAMMFGIVIGTYSSIFVASPIVLFTGKKSLIKR